MNPVDPVTFSEYLIKKAAQEAQAANPMVPKTVDGNALEENSNKELSGSITRMKQLLNLQQNSKLNPKPTKSASMSDPCEFGSLIVDKINAEFTKAAAAAEDPWLFTEESKSAGAVPMQGVSQMPEAPVSAVPVTQAQRQQQGDQDMSMHVARLQNISPDGSNVDGSMFESAGALYGEVSDNTGHPAYGLLQQSMAPLGMAVGLDLSDPQQASIFDSKMKEMGKGLMKSGPAESSAWRSILSDQSRLAQFFTQTSGKGK